MSSQLYARYVPPVKKATAPSDAAVNVPPQQIPQCSVATVVQPTKQQAITKPDASSTYARYIPPNTASKHQSSSPTNTPQNGQLTPTQKRKYEDTTHSIDTPVSAKRIKKTKSSAETSDTLINGDVEPRRKKEKNNNRKTTEKQSAQDEALEPLEEPGLLNGDDRRHTALLAKRAKSLKKAERVARKSAKVAAESGQAPEELPRVDEKPEELHALEPFPQPEPVPETLRSTSAILPPWLASPIRVAPNAAASFDDLGLPDDAIKVLQSRGFKNAFAVQAAVLPLLLPDSRKETNDVLVSAATGSGKTLSYVLPIVRDIVNTTVPRLRGLIVMPTRELVQQAREVCETCANAFSTGTTRRINIGIAVGNQTLKAEQASLMNEEQRYDPEEYRRREIKSSAKWETASDESDDEEEFNILDEETTFGLPDHISTYSPKVDILICTPGRLVEHINSTPGFTLEYVKWLVVDEADKLLDQSFQRWLEVVMAGLSKDAGHRTRKIVLSATITRDLGQLSGLKLYRPKLVILEGSTENDDGENDDRSGAKLALPDTLFESAIKVSDDGDKPLYLMHLLQTSLSEQVTRHPGVKTDKKITAENSSSSSDTSSSSGDDSSSSSDDEDSEDDTSSSGESSTSHSAKTASSAIEDVDSVNKPSDHPRGVLIFTKSNENAIRLSRLITLMDPTFSASIGTLTSTIRNSTRRKTLAAFSHSKISILVASELVARGLDLPNLAHVINYDMPSSLTSYVHRVGRTARAGNEGHAWTLFTNTEARWFWNEIARSALVDRPQAKKVARVNVDKSRFGEEKRSVYEAALTSLGQEAGHQSG